MKRLTSLLLIMHMSISSSGCATTFQEIRRWKEEVKFADGAVITFDRAEFIGRRIPLVERSEIRFTTSNGMQIHWTSCAQPFAVDWLDEALYVLAIAEFSFCTAELSTRQGGGFAAWRVTSEGSKRLRFEDVPRRLMPNLVVDGELAQKKGFIQVGAKFGELRTRGQINWCAEAWKADGLLDQCKSKEGN